MKKLSIILSGFVVFFTIVITPPPAMAATSLQLPAETRVAFVGNGAGQ